MLTISELRAGYGEAEVLHGVSLTIESGEIVALLGSNGAGKSTLINNVSGIYRPFAGRVAFAGQDITGQTASHIVELGLIQVPEGRRIFPNMTVRENLSLGGYRRGRERRAQNLEQIIDIFPRLRERLRQLAGTLSGGEQQMLAIGRGLMSEPKLLILDEPSLGLSPLLVEEMFTLIGRLNQENKLAMLLVEQNVVQSLDIADRAYVLENGMITLEGVAAELSRDDRLRKAYLGM